MMTPKPWMLGAALVAALGATGCATHEYVDKHLAAVDSKITDAQSQADANKAMLAGHDAKLGELDRTTREALERATAAGKLAEGKFLYSVVLSDDGVKFPVASTKLSKEAEDRLAQLAEKLKGDNKNVYLEIQGYTDASGAPVVNDRLGQERADTVRKYLSEQGVPLNRMSTISYGEDKPVAPNKTKKGRAENRRVVVVVLS
jgi:peptidoglycan-associated lipoprotein